MPVSRRVDPETDPLCELVPRPSEDEPVKSSVRGTLVVALVMFGWLLIVFGMSAAVARNDPGGEAPVSMERGVVVTPAEGWYSAEDDQRVGASQLVLQKSGAYVTFTVAAFEGTSEELLGYAVQQLQTSFESFRALPERSVVVAGDRELPAALVQFTGVTEWGSEEGELVALSYGGTGVVMLAEALPGQLRWLQGDVDKMWQTLEVSE